MQISIHILEILMNTEYKIESYTNLENVKNLVNIINLYKEKVKNDKI